MCKTLHIHTGFDIPALRPDLVVGHRIKSSSLERMSFIMPTTKKKSGKRANGEGTFYQQDDRTWVHQVTLGRKPNGKPDRKTFTGRTRAECVSKRDAYNAEKLRIEQKEAEELESRLEMLAEAEKRGHSLLSEIPFEDAFGHWLQLFKAPPTKKATTYSAYVNTNKVHFQPYFGTMMLYEITRMSFRSITTTNNCAARCATAGPAVCPPRRYATIICCSKTSFHTLSKSKDWPPTPRSEPSGRPSTHSSAVS